MRKDDAKKALERTDLFNYEALKELLSREREENGKKVVFTTGVWDLLHEGHTRYLRKAKECGDILVVGVDTDEWTKKRKGPSRPFVLEEQRVELLHELRSVDYLVLIGSLENYEECINILHPDVLVISQTTKDFPEERKKRYLQYCERLEMFEPK